LAEALARAAHQDMKVLLGFVTDDLREALDHAPPGIMDPRIHGRTGYFAPPSAFHGYADRLQR